MVVSGINVSSTQQDSDALFYEALQRPEDQQADWLRQQCGENEALLTELLSLLEAHQRSGEFLQQAAPWPPPGGQDLSGRIVGAYRIDSLIAQGGMGQVYRARRNDGSYEQIVAIKVVEQGGVQARLFLSERQILADLNHPAISTILDGGVIEDSGHPYLVMEYIDGMPITGYVYQQGLSFAQRIGLFDSLLDAVAQAHQHGVIHCDLKPANIFVDHNGDLKLLDFGVAFAVERSLSESSDSVKHYGLTPGFSSPQRLSGARPVVADDIYSLGVVFALVMTQTDPAQYKPALSSSMQQLAASLSEEAAAIFRKATHSDPAQRYAGIEAFREELQDWQAHRPLRAVDNSPLYVFQKVLRRHWGAWLAMGLLLGVLASSSIAWLQNDRADRAQALAELQVDVAVNLAESVIRDLDVKVMLLEGSTLVRLNAAKAALDRLEEINVAQPGNIKIERALARAHLRIGGLLAHPFLMHIGKIEEGRQHIRKAYLLLKDVYRQQATRDNLMALIRGERFIAAQLAVVEGKLADALKLETDRLQQIKQLKQLDAVAKSRIGTKYTIISHLLVGMGRLEEAEIAYDKAANYLRMPDLSEPEYMQERMRRGYHFYLDELAILALVKGDYLSAETQMKASLERHRGQILWLDRSRVIQANHSLACIALLEHKDTPRALTYLRKAQQQSNSLAKAYPASASMQWLARRYSVLAEIESTQYQGDTRAEALISNFQCRTPSAISNPVGPPEGWESIRKQLSFSFVDVISP